MGTIFYSCFRWLQVFFLTVVDDATRATWLFLMKSKSEVRQLFSSFYTMVHTQFGLKIKAVRTDNAKEFDMFDFFNSHGIIYQLSCIYNPQQNSIVERKHQHLLSIARALQIQSQLPIKFWGDCVLHVAYLINRLPSPLLHDKTPFELLFHKLPDYSLLKVLVACVLHPLSHIPEPNFLQGQGSVFFLAFLLMLKDKRSLTLTLILFLFLGMSFFMKMFSHLF